MIDAEFEEKRRTKEGGYGRAAFRGSEAPLFPCRPPRIWVWPSPCTPSSAAGRCSCHSPRSPAPVRPGDDCTSSETGTSTASTTTRQTSSAAPPADTSSSDTGVDTTTGGLCVTELPAIVTTSTRRSRSPTPSSSCSSRRDLRSVEREGAPRCLTGVRGPRLSRPVSPARARASPRPRVRRRASSHEQWLVDHGYRRTRTDRGRSLRGARARRVGAHVQGRSD